MKTWSFILDKTKDNIQVVLLVVIDSYGSSPGRRGFKMLVAEDGQRIGSVGGGSMEQRMVKQARKMLSERSARVEVKNQEHHIEADDDTSGMICSGSQTIALYPITKSLLNEVVTINSFMNEKGVGVIKYSPSGFSLIKNAKQKKRFQSNVISDDQWEMTEQTGMPDKLYIFGAGHVSLAFSQIASILGFEIELFDNREGLSTFNDNHYVYRKRIVDFNDIGDLVQEGNFSYAVIMSYSHLNDEKLLAQLLNKELRYLGMMGSKNKVKTIMSNLIEKGYTKEQLSTVHAPIGISINSQTPMEIAISVVAEIISVRNG